MDKIRSCNQVTQLTVVSVSTISPKKTLGDHLIKQQTHFFLEFTKNQGILKTQNRPPQCVKKSPKNFLQT